MFSRRRDAEAAIKRYDNVQLDGKPMKIDLVGTNLGNDGGQNAANAVYGNPNGAPRRYYHKTCYTCCYIIRNILHETDYRVYFMIFGT